MTMLYQYQPGDLKFTTGKKADVSALRNLVRFAAGLNKAQDDQESIPFLAWAIQLIVGCTAETSLTCARDLILSQAGDPSARSLDVLVNLIFKRVQGVLAAPPTPLPNYLPLLHDVHLAIDPKRNNKIVAIGGIVPVQGEYLLDKLKKLTNGSVCIGRLSRICVCRDCLGQNIEPWMVAHYVEQAEAYVDEFLKQEASLYAFLYKDSLLDSLLLTEHGFNVLPDSTAIRYSAAPSYRQFVPHQQATLAGQDVPTGGNSG